MAQKQTSKVAKPQKQKTTKKNFGLSDKAIGCLTVGCLFENKTESEMVESLISIHLAKYTAYCDGRKFAGPVMASVSVESASGSHEVNSPVQLS